MTERVAAAGGEQSLPAASPRRGGEYPSAVLSEASAVDSGRTWTHCPLCGLLWASEDRHGICTHSPADYRSWLAQAADEIARLTAPKKMGRPREVPEEIVSYIRDLHAQGMNPNAIARRLNEEGTPSARGGKWWDETVRWILRRY